jgi:hypothetical protein
MPDPFVVQEVGSLALATCDDDYIAIYQRLIEAVAASIAHSSRSSSESDLLRFCEFLITNSRRSHSQLFQDLWVAFELNEKRAGYFVEFGACDGLHLSNTLMLENSYGWTGIIGDPNPKYKRALRKNRKCKVTSRCVYPGPRKLRPFRCTADGAFSTLEEFAQKDAHWEEYRSTEYEHVNVYTVSINDILQRVKAPSVIDYLSLDTEGSELEILRDLDFDKWKVSVITVEHNYTPRRQEIHDLLQSQGYVRKWSAMSRWDDWYVFQ